ncbi:MAG: hypothetical protein K6F09_04990 [Clostridiales bacterium]|nr:hypothetical protein [Clostridiales bacterium]
MTLFMILSLSQLGFYAYAWNGTTTVQPALNNEGYYIIDSAEKLAWFAARVNGSVSGGNSINGIVATDIALNSAGSTTNKWTPIGTYDRPYLGKFIGGGYSISGVCVSGSSDYRGFFGCLGVTETTVQETDDNGALVYNNDGTPVMIKHKVPAEVNYVTLENASISGALDVGGIAGYSNGAKVYGCSVSGTVTGSGNNVAGIVGYCRNAAVVQDCVSKATVSGVNRVGGIVGYNFSNCVIKGCCNHGSVTGSMHVGGLAGTSSGSEVSHSYSKGAITASSNNAGGLIGYVVYGDIERNYTISTVSCSGTNVGAVFGNFSYGTNTQKCYYDKDNSTLTDSWGVAAEHDFMMDETMITSLNVGYDTFTADYFVQNSGYPIFRWELVTWNGSLSRPNQDSSGVYLISNGSELAWFGALVNGTLSGVTQNTAANARVTKDILLNTDLFNESSNEWTPIGNINNQFVGNFDGGSHHINGIYIAAGGFYQGLFGYIGAGGTVSNIYTEKSSVTGTNNVAVIAGWNAGTITNCHNFTYAKGTENVGGMAGTNVGSITSCTNLGEITGNLSCGGITGKNAVGGVVTQCYNTGYIHKFSAAQQYNFGGIVGDNIGTVTNCYNMGRIEAISYVGGIVGKQESGEVRAVYSTGYIDCKIGYKGAVMGYYAAGTISYCYYDNQRCGVSDTSGVSVGYTTTQMTTQSLSTFAGFSSTYWIIRSSDVYFNYYPEIRVFYFSSDSYISTASKKSAMVLKSNYHITAEIDGEITSYYSTLGTAAAHIGTGEGTLTVLGNTSESAVIPITGRVTIKSDGTPHTVTRASGAASKNLFEISGELTVNPGGTDDDPLLIFDGGSGAGISGLSLIRISVSGALNLYPGTKLTNNSATSNGSGIYNNGGALYMSGGVISGNSTSLNGGGIFNYGGEAILDISGGTISGNSASSNGGGIYCEGALSSDGDTEPTPLINFSNLTVSGNTAVTGGGGIYNKNSTIAFSGAAVSQNNASSGGGLYNTGKILLTSGEFTGNTATTGSGIYQGGIFKVSGNLSVSDDSNIFIKSGKTIENVGNITTSGIAAYLYIENYVSGAQVLSGEFCAVSYQHYSTLTQNGVKLYLTSTGYLIDRETTPVALLSVFGADDTRYTSIKEAVAAIEEIGNEDSRIGIIRLIGDDIIDEKIIVSSDITIVSDGAEVRTIRRDPAYTGAMFEVSPAGSLTFGNSDDDKNAFLVLDGGYTLTGENTESLVINKGSCTISGGVTLSDNHKSGNGGAVYNEASLMIRGGALTENTAALGGAVYSTAAGSTEISGGTFTGNNATNGGAVYLVSSSDEDEVISGGTFTGNTAVTNGGAIANSGGVMTVIGGEISGNTAVNGGGIANLNGGTLKIKAGVLGADDDHVLLKENPASPVAGATYGTSYGLVSYEVLSSALISDNEATYGGGVASVGGTLDVKGGTISENSASYGGGVALLGASSMTLDSESITYLGNVVYQYNHDTLPTDVPISASAEECTSDASMTIRANTASSGGGGIYVSPNAVLTDNASTISANVSENGGAAYNAGTFVMNGNAVIDENNTVFLVSGKTLTPGVYSSGSGIIAKLQPEIYDIGVVVLSGSNISSVNTRFSLSFARYFITTGGALESDEIVLKSTANVFMNYDDNIVYGIGDGSDTAGEILSNFANTESGLYVKGKKLTKTYNSEEGIYEYTMGRSVERLSGSDILYTGCVIYLSNDGGNTELDRATVVLVGDTDRNGFINGADALVAAFIAAGLVTKNNIGADSYRAADANNDGVVTVADSDLLERCGLLKAAVSQPTRADT